MNCDFAQYRDFEHRLIASAKVKGVENPSHIEVGIDGPDGANRLHIFTGVAEVGFIAKDDDILRRGTCSIALLDLPISPAVHIIASATNAGFASVFSNDDEYQITFAIDCVSTAPADVLNPITALHQTVPVITMALAVQGGGGGTGISRVAYQANILVKSTEVQLASILVSNLEETVDMLGVIGPPVFSPNITIPPVTAWGGRVKLTGPAPAPGIFVGLSSDDPALVSTPPSVAIMAGSDAGDFNSPKVGNHNGTGVITATLKGVSMTATVNVVDPE